jgi:hypothetical protein
MTTTLKPGDRVRLKDTVTFGTVVEVSDTTADGSPSEVVVEWDGHEGTHSSVAVDELDYVRPPPGSWSNLAGPLPFCDR